VLATALVVLAASAADLIDHGFSLGIPALDSASDGGVFGILVDVAVAAAAAAAWVVTARVRSVRPTAAVLAVLLTFLAVDQASALHDRIPHWLAFYLPVLIASFGCLVAMAGGVPGLPRSRPGRAGLDRVLVAGLGLLIFSFLLHLFGERLLAGLGASSPAGWAYQVKAVVKHGTEVAGWLLIALGLLRLGLSGGLPHRQQERMAGTARMTGLPR
jgi:hypothetical protein